MQEFNGNYISTKEGIRDALRRNERMGKRKIGMPVKDIRPKDSQYEFLKAYVFDRLNMSPMEMLRSLEHQYFSEQDWRNRRQRNIDFTRGRHFGEPVWDADVRKWVTQWEYLKRRNMPALTYNVVSKLSRSLVGQFREVNTGNIVRCESKDNRGNELAHDLTLCLERIKNNNKSKQKDARNMKEMLHSGRPVFKVLWGSKNNMSKKDVRYRVVEACKFMMNPGIVDEDLANFHTACEIHDTDVDSIVEMFANGDYERGYEIKQEYVKFQGNQRKQASYSSQSMDGSQLRNQTFYTQGLGNASCRYYEVWTKISDYEASTYDPLEIPGNDFKTYKWRDPNDVKKEIDKINEERITNADGDVPEEDILIQFSANYRSRNYAMYLSPWGFLLDVRESPYKNGEIPYVFPSSDLNGEVWGLIEEVLNAQLGLDRQILQADAILANASKGVWMIPETAVPDNMSPREYINEIKKVDGAVIVKMRDGYEAADSMPKQQYAQAANVGNQVQQMIQLYSGLVDEISGNFGAAQGRSDSSAKTATGYALESQNAGLNVRDTFENYLDVLVQRDELILQFIKEGYTKQDYQKILGIDLDPAELKTYEFSIEQSKGTNSPAYKMSMEQELLQLVFNQLLPFEVFLDISSNPIMNQAKQKLQEYNKNQSMSGGQQIPGAGAPTFQPASDQQYAMVQGHPQGEMLNESPVTQQGRKLAALPQQNIQ
jgi:hypothetical protein